MKLFSTKHIVTLLTIVIIGGCAKIPIKQYYVLNYIPSTSRDRLYHKAYPYTIRLQELGVEEAYNRPQIVYRKSPFSIQYYFYHLWAVKPERMITDLIQRHLLSTNLVSNVTRRLDASSKPDYEMSGMIEAIEEYDSEGLWFAHLALRIQLVRTSDGRIIYTRRFDNRKRIYQHEPEYIIRELSSILEFIMTQVIHDIDVKFASELGLTIKQQDDPYPDVNSVVDTTISGVR